jgi:nicotinate-nucleotide adenylyltransferase
MTERLGILGGTFDPVHLGHLQAARDTAAACALDRVLLVLSARPPHKPQAAPASVNDRLAMLELAAADDPLFVVSDIEARRDGPSYMVDTLAELARESPQTTLALIMGYDAYRDIDTWHRAGDLLELADLIVTSRPEVPLTEAVEPPIAARKACCYDPGIGCHVHSSGHSLRFHQLSTGLSVSASAVRAFRQRGDDIRPLVGAPVAAYIERLGLYLPTT